ncbi:hypothetical protein [Gimesia panareensis]|uniref:Uncharacterized protein n=1 Tax=Gimesia panareensis TaxID=2527978 RepID=A0A517PZR4_9PLAN|nr:hypothetical protein [Gimesia panareensis]QDT24870.1 hypothetical protein Enr10x_01620 [Gimesia panareensis]QDU47816.1 hypothetical protein Pan110_01260 [Gimesia panareensis]
MSQQAFSMMLRPRLWTLLAGLLLVCANGCATTPYVYQPPLITHPDLDFPEDEPQVVRGKRRPVIDGIGWVVGIPGKILLWDRRIDNHNVSPETEAAIAEYLEKNGLDQVKVRVNEYDPLGEWKRLRKNKAVGWGWRYTAGTLTAVAYTLLPGRIIGGDNYNPFTNTISLYSDHPAIALHEGGHSKDFGTRKWKGTYAVFTALPGASLWPEAIATNDALGYLETEQNFAGEADAYQVLYPAYATYIAGTASPFLPYSDLLIKAGAVIPGHLAGRWKAREVKQEALARQQSSSEIQQVHFEVPATPVEANANSDDGVGQR